MLVDEGAQRDAGKGDEWREIHQTDLLVVNFVTTVAHF